MPSVEPVSGQWVVLIHQRNGAGVIGPFDSWDDANTFALGRQLPGLTLIRELFRPDQFSEVATDG